MSTRSAGFQTIDQTLLSPGSKFTFIILMFIGGSPSSTAGGIRTTTLMVVIASIFAKIKGKKDIVMFNRRIPEQKVRDSLLVMIVAILIVALASIVIFYTLSTLSDEQHDKFTIINSFYEVASAFGTVGLSTGITQNIGNVGLVILILVMFIGQMGISVTLLSWTRHDPKGNLIRYPKEDLRIG
jgi:trk system potassium uptake protein TrkH